MKIYRINLYSWKITAGFVKKSYKSYKNPAFISKFAPEIEKPRKSFCDGQ